MALAPILDLSILEEVERRSIKWKCIRPKRVQAFEYDDNEFISLFRLNEKLALQVIESLRPTLEPRTSRKNVFSVETKVLCALRFYASGSYQKGIANEVTNSMCQQSVSKIVGEVTDVINSQLLRKWIKFPAIKRELDMLKLEFIKYSNFPGVIGAIDCTHIAIIAPSDDAFHSEKNYVNRKNFHSINVQIVCDMQQKILNICARYPGSVHDAYIWRSSNLRCMFENNESSVKNSWLLGDSGYPLEPWLLTPYEETPLDSGGEKYNKAHSRARSVIERCNGTLKSSFRCLLKHRVLHYSPEISAKIINAYVVLHNMRVSENLTIVTSIDDEDLLFNTRENDTGTASHQSELIRQRMMSTFI